MQMDQRRVAIVGAGPGGLTLARILAVRGVACTVFELDSHALARPQGGSLDLHAESGQHALREAGLHAEFTKLARYEDQGDALYDSTGKELFRHADAGSDARPEIDRTQLRDLLLASLPADRLRWGSKVDTPEPLANGRVRVVGEEFDLVVGADGAWSRVRPLVSSTVPTYTGVTFVEVGIDDVDRLHPEVAALVPNGKVSIPGADRALIAQRSSGGHVRAYYMFLCPDGGTGVDFSSTESARSTLLARFADWDPRFLCFARSGTSFCPRPIVELPIGHRWEHRAGVTLLGDAAHVMSPFTGEGVNLAMHDAADLAAALTGANWDQSVTDYEAHMFERAAESAAQSHEGLCFVSERGLDYMLEHFRAIA